MHPKCDHEQGVSCGGPLLSNWAQAFECDQQLPLPRAARLSLLVVQALLQDVYHTQPGITCLILKLAADIVEAHISYAQA